MSSLPAPWTPHRAIAETVGHAIADALTIAVGSHVQLGVASSCDPEEMLGGRPLPLHAIVVRMQRPLRDVMVFVSSLREEVVRPLVEVAARTALTALEVPTGSDASGDLGSFIVEDAIDFDQLDEALEQCDALYLEAIYSLELPTGELQMVLGSGLLESASFLGQGVIDPHCEGAPYVPPSAATATHAASELDMDAAVTMPADDLSIDARPVAAPLVGAIDALDAVLAEQEHVAAAAPVVGLSAAAIAQSAIADASTSRWAELLSGVEVELSAELGRADLPLGDITSLNGESVLTLDQLVHDPVTVYVNGTPYATARLVVVDGEYGIEIIEVVDQGNIISILAA